MRFFETGNLKKVIYIYHLARNGYTVDPGIVGPCFPRIAVIPIE